MENADQIGQASFFGRSEFHVVLKTADCRKLLARISYLSREAFMLDAAQAVNFLRSLGFAFFFSTSWAESSGGESVN